MDKILEHEKICKELNEIYAKKNADYGNSFGDTFQKLGLISAITRISDKYNRICNLATKNSNETKVKDETIEDTLKDLANYCIMTLIEMQYKNITQTTSATKRSIKSDKLEISDKENSLSSEIERFIS